MDLSDAYYRLGAGGSILLRKDSPCLADLSRGLGECGRRTVVIWALGCTRDTVRTLESIIPDDRRPGIALDAASRWARGEIRMPEAKRAILDVHGMACGLPLWQSALCHAVGQGCSVVHTPGHALGLPIYELSSMIMEHGIGCEEEVSSKLEHYIEVLDSVSDEDIASRAWASFLQS